MVLTICRHTRDNPQPNPDSRTIHGLLRVCAPPLGGGAPRVGDHPRLPPVLRLSPPSLSRGGDGRAAQSGGGGADDFAAQGNASPTQGDPLPPTPMIIFQPNPNPHTLSLRAAFPHPRAHPIPRVSLSPPLESLAPFVRRCSVRFDQSNVSRTHLFFRPSNSLTHHSHFSHSTHTPIRLHHRFSRPIDFTTAFPVPSTSPHFFFPSNPLTLPFDSLPFTTSHHFFPHPIDFTTSCPVQSTHSHSTRSDSTSSTSVFVQSTHSHSTDSQITTLLPFDSLPFFNRTSPLPPSHRLDHISSRPIHSLPIRLSPIHNFTTSNQLTPIRLTPIQLHHICHRPIKSLPFKLHLILCPSHQPTPIQLTHTSIHFSNPFDLLRFNFTTSFSVQSTSPHPFPFNQRTPNQLTPI